MTEQLPSSSISPPISESLWWAVPSWLAGVRKPTEEELSVLRGLEIGAIVSILSDDANLELYKRHNFPHLWVPVVGSTAPTLPQLQQLKTFINSQNESGNAVAVHCSNGLRRTGTVLAALLIQQGANYERAMTAIQTANPAVELSEAQTSFLKNVTTQA